MAAQSQLMQQQYAAGLRLKQNEKTGNFYKHIYCNSAYRLNKSDPASNYEVFLQNEIVIPPDGNTKIKIQRANIPMTFNNVIKSVSFSISNAGNTLQGSGGTIVITLPVGYYNPVQSETLLAAGGLVGYNETFAFDILGRINKILATAFVAGPIWNNLRVQITVTNRLQFYDRTTGAVVPVTLTFGLNGTDADYGKRILGFSPFPANQNVFDNVIQSPNIYGPYFYSELFIRIASIPINYDLIDMRNQAPADILAVVPINVDTFGQVITVGPMDSLVYSFAPNSRVSRIRLQLTYSDATLVDTQGQDWSCVLSIVKENPDDINPAQLRTPI